MNTTTAAPAAADAATAAYWTGDLVNHQKLGKARLIADQGDGTWTAEWLSGRYAGQTRVITPSADKTRMLEAAERPAPAPAEEAPAKPAKAAKPAKEEAPVWPAEKPAIEVSEPPTAERTRRRNPVDFPRVAREVKALDGAWAEILEAADKATSAGHVAHKARHGVLPGFAPAGAYEAKNVGERVWVRYVGA